MGQMSPLRRRMIEDMTVGNLAPATQQSYLYPAFLTRFSRTSGKRRISSAFRTSAKNSLFAGPVEPRDATRLFASDTPKPTTGCEKCGLESS